MKEMVNVSIKLHKLSERQMIFHEIRELILVVTLLFSSWNVSVIFNWIKFRNDVCHAKDYNTEHHEYDEDGVCYTSEECSSRGGLHKANCAAGYGACCVCKTTSCSKFLVFKLI